MKYGICFGIEHPEFTETAKKAGFDYVECGFCNLSRGSDELFESFKRSLEKNNIKCLAANGFFPKDIPLLGEGCDREKITAYVENGMKRGRQIGLEKIAFGSSKARSIPEGMSYEEAFTGLCRVLSDDIAPLAQKYGITVVTEPLRKDECNIINTLREGVLLSVCTGKSNISCLADIYHMIGGGDDLRELMFLKGSIRHGHISNPYSRRGLKRDFPIDESEYDYRSFIAALEYAGCDTCSIEAQYVDFEKEAFAAGKLLKGMKV